MPMPVKKTTASEYLSKSPALSVTTKNEIIGKPAVETVVKSTPSLAPSGGGGGGSPAPATEPVKPISLNLETKIANVQEKNYAQQNKFIKMKELINIKTSDFPEDVKQQMKQDVLSQSIYQPITPSLATIVKQGGTLTKTEKETATGIEITYTGTPSEKTQQRYEKSFRASTRISYLRDKNKKVPSWFSEQVGLPAEFSTATIDIPDIEQKYERVAFEKYLGAPSGKSENEFQNSLMRSFSYTSSMPIWKTEGGETKTFSQLKESEPALFLTKNKKGLYVPEFDVKRWSREAWVGLGSQDMGGVKQAGLAAGESITGLFDIDFWTSEDREQYNAMRRYETFKGVKEGGLSLVKTWASVQVPAYSNVILPLAGGFAFGKISQGIKLAGGLGKASTGLKIGYAGMTGMGTVFGAKSAFDIKTDIESGDMRRLASSGISLGSSLVLGGVGYRSGRISANNVFRNKYPNIQWGSEGIPVGQQRFSFSGMEKSVPSSFNKRLFVKTSQLFKPGPKTSLYIDFPGSPSSIGSKLSMKAMMYGKNIIGTASIVSKTKGTMFGRRAWSSKSMFLNRQTPVIGSSEIKLSMIRGNLRKGDINLFSDFNRIRNWNARYNTASMSLLPRLDYLTPRSKFNLGSFEIPKFGYIGGVGTTPLFIHAHSNYQTPVFKSEFKTSSVVSPMISPSFISKQKTFFKQKMVIFNDNTQLSLSGSILGVKQAQKQATMTDMMYQQEYKQKYSFKQPNTRYGLGMVFPEEKLPGSGSRGNIFSMWGLEKKFRSKKMINPLAEMKKDFRRRGGLFG